MKPMRAKKFGIAAATMALAAGMSVAMVGSAYAGSAAVSGSTEWADPTGAVPITKTIDGKQYKYITTWADMWAGAGPDYVGVSNSSLLGYGSGAITLEQAKKSSLFGIWASSANEEVNPYQANYYWNLYATSLGRTSETTEAAATINPPSWDSASGVWSAFKFRPEFMIRCNGMADTVSRNCPMAYSDALGYINRLEYYTSADADVSSGKSSPYYQTGDETYTPERHTAHNENPFTFVDEFYYEAQLSEDIMKDTASNPQLASGQTPDWRTANTLPRTTRYTQTPTDCALDVEKLIRGSIYYTLSKINDGTVEKKKVAYLINSPEATGTTVQIASFDFTEGISTTGYSESGQQGTGTTTRYNCNGFASFSPLVVDQARGAKAQQVWRGGVHIPSTNDTGYYWDAPFTAYEVTADDLLDCDIIYGLAGTMKADELQTWMSNNVTGGTAAKQKVADMKFLTEAPAIVKGANYTAEKLTYGVYAISAFYPEIFPNMELAAYWFDNVYHLKSDSVATAMNYAYANASLPDEVQLSNLANGYSEASIDKKAVQGYEYFNSAKNTDPVLSRVLANKDLDGNTSGKDDNTTSVQGDYDFSSIAPSDYYAAWAKANPSVKSQTIKLTGASKSFKVKALKKAKKTFTVKVSGAKTALTLTQNAKAKKAKVKAKASGKTKVKVTVPKGTKKGTYKITVKAKKTSSYKASAAKTITVKVK